MTKQTTLISFHGRQVVKDTYLKRLQQHYAADEIIQGVYWHNGKGCAVGCTIHSGIHSDYETELGIPTALARIEDRIFERLPNEAAKEFPLQFLSAIPLGADLSKVAFQFAIWALIDSKDGLINFVKNANLIEFITYLAEAFQEVLDTGKVSSDTLKKIKNAALAALADLAALAALAALADLAAARSASAIKSRDKLIELLKACEPCKK